MFEISAGGGGGTRLSDRLNAGNSDVPPAGTSARKAYERTQREGTGKPETTKDKLLGTYDTPLKDSLSQFSYEKPHKRKRASGDSGGSGGSSHHSSAKRSWDYYEAPLAEKYGFGKATAYQEALANTAHRREMEDMRKAGLNPSVIYGSHSPNGADSSIYPREASSGSSGGSGGSGGYRRRTGRSSNYAFSGAAYYGLMFAAGALTAAITKNVGAGMAASGLAATAMKALNGFFKR